MSSPWPSPRPPVEVRARGPIAEYRQATAAAARLLGTPAGWARWLTLAADHPGFTASNLLAVLAARPTATAVADSDEWAQRGRRVRPGERNRGIAILGGYAQRDTLSYVWDITQTEGAALPARPGGGDPQQVADALGALFVDRGYQLHLGPSRGLHLDGQRLVVPEGPPTRQALELAHAMAHRMLHPAVTHSRDGAPCVGVVYAEAVTAAWLIATRAGLDTGAPPEPPAHVWAASRDPAAAARTAAGRAAGVAEQVGRELAAPRRPDVVTPRLQTGADTARAVETQAEAVLARVTRPRTRPAAVPTPAPETTTARAVEALTEAADWYRNMLIHQAAGVGARRTLADRGLAPVAREDLRWALGYAPPGPRALYDHLHALGFTDEELLAAGLIRRTGEGVITDLFRDRIMCGVKDSAGQVVGFVGRATERALARYPGLPKYLNSPTSALFRKDELLIGLTENAPALADGTRPVLVEGFMDALAAAAVAHAGGPAIAAVAPSGTAFTAEQAAVLLAACPPRPQVVVAFDPDPAGQQAAVRAYHQLYGAASDLLRPRLPGDPAEVLQQHGTAHLGSLLTDDRLLTPLATTVIDQRLAVWFDPRVADRLQFYESRVTVARSLAPTLAAEPQRLGELISYLTDRLNYGHPYTNPRGEDPPPLLEATHVADLVMTEVSDNAENVLTKVGTRGSAPSPPLAPPEPGRLHALTFPSPPTAAPAAATAALSPPAESPAGRRPHR